MDISDRVTIILARIERCACERAAMQAMNEMRADQGFAQAYDADAFADLPSKHQIEEGTVTAFLGW